MKLSNALIIMAIYHTIKHSTNSWISWVKRELVESLCKTEWQQDSVSCSYRYITAIKTSPSSKRGTQCAVYNGNMRCTAIACCQVLMHHSHVHSSWLLTYNNTSALYMMGLQWFMVGLSFCSLCSSSIDLGEGAEYNLNNMIQVKNPPRTCVYLKDQVVEV